MATTLYNRMRTVGLMAGLALGGGVGHLSAAAIPDQSFVPINHLGGLEVTASQIDAQTFTVGVEGLLTRVDLIGVNHHRCFATENLVVELRATAGGVPTSTILASRVLLPASIPTVSGTVTVDFSATPVAVQVGDVLAIVLRSNAAPSGCTYAWDGDVPGTYAGGGSFISFDGITWFDTPRDMGFRTFVESEDDDDDDGVPDETDVCPASDLSARVTIDGCNSGVLNALFANGCTVSDLVGVCARDARNHGGFVRCVAGLTNELKKARMITGREAGKLQSCAAQAGLP